ncbi:hypothetical protein Ahy_B05g075080 isoform B [Arachis hypogaea]|uniref:Uncharacterized protein n=1 Tax=Arachis hypogaea TaxID=3818 RepID=A0A444Z0U0_ARAHY|nr:hypothetical protein Ahy_B05g075080 isoform B [Arachis hypogaea]
MEMCKLRFAKPKTKKLSHLQNAGYVLHDPKSESCNNLQNAASNWQRSRSTAQKCVPVPCMQTGPALLTILEVQKRKLCLAAGQAKTQVAFGSLPSCMHATCWRRVLRGVFKTQDATRGGVLLKSEECCVRVVQIGVCKGVRKLVGGRKRVLSLGSFGS